MTKDEVNQAWQDNTPLKYGEPKVYVIGVTEMNGTAQIKLAAQPDLPPIDVKFSELKG